MTSSHSFVDGSLLRSVVSLGGVCAVCLFISCGAPIEDTNKIRPGRVHPTGTTQDQLNPNSPPSTTEPSDQSSPDPDQNKPSVLGEPDAFLGNEGQGDGASDSAVAEEPALGPATPQAGVPIPSTGPAAQAGNIDKQMQDALRFREDFLALAQSRYTRSQFDTLVYLPNERVLSSATASIPGENPLDGIKSALRGVLPSQLYDLGRGQTVSKDHDPIGVLRHHPITILSFPGIFVEGSASRPFEDVLRKQKSRAARDWHDLVTWKSGEPGFLDSAFSLRKLTNEVVRIDDVLDVASVDDGEDNALVRLVYLTPRLGSLETFGILTDNTARYLQRIDKYFAATGDTNDVYLLGYSRGAAAALDFLVAARAHPEFQSWAGRIRGVYSLGGSLNGSPFADLYIQKPSGLGNIIHTMKNLARDLETPSRADSFRERLGIVWRNLRRWWSAYGSITTPEPPAPTDEGLVAEGIQSDRIDLLSSFILVRQILFTTFNATAWPGLEYEQNVRRFKALMREVDEGMHSLGSPERSKWWRTHVLPPDVRYYSILSTMYDRSTRDHVSELARNPLAFNDKSMDYAMNRNSYYDLTKLTGVDLSDGAVTGIEATISSSFAQSVNPSQPPFFATTLGILGSHHWSSVMPFGIKTVGDKGSPFPRDLLLTALAAFAAEE